MNLDREGHIVRRHLGEEVQEAETLLPEPQTTRNTLRESDLGIRTVARQAHYRPWSSG